MNLKETSCDHPMIAPSILAADFANLGRDVQTAAQGGAEVLHIDIMDGHFVPNLSMGSCIVKSLRPVSQMLFDVHLMITDPEKYVDGFIKAGAEHITIHVESRGNLHKLLQKIHDAGCTAGMTLRPGTPVESLVPYLPMLDMALVMTVEPGFGGQSFMAHQLQKVAFLRKYATAHKQNLHIQVDGGIGAGNIAQARQAGANIFVAGSSVFAPGKSPVEGVEKLLNALH